MGKFDFVAAYDKIFVDAVGPGALAGESRRPLALIAVLAASVHLLVLLEQHFTCSTTSFD